jgi:hypothetical protein
MGLGSGIQDPRFVIQDPSPAVKKASDPGSGIQIRNTECTILHLENTNN